MNRDNHWIIRYALALASVAAAFLLRHGIVLLVGEELPPWITFYPTVMFVALAAGPGPGLLATVASALTADYFYFLPVGNLEIASFSKLISLSLFSGMGVFMSVVAGLYRRTKEHLWDLVEERTRELARANEVLKREMDEHRLAEEALRQQADLLRLSFEAIILWRLDGGIESWNRGAELLYGYSAGEAIGRITHELLKSIHPVPWPEVRAILLNRGNWEGELRHRTRDGREVIVSARKQIIQGSDGIIRVLETNRDITERKRAEEALLESEAKYRDLFTNMSEEVHFWELVHDEDGEIKTWRLVDANPPALKTWGKELDEIKGKTTDEIFGPEATDHYLPIVQKIMSEAVPYTFEDYFPNLDKYFRFTSVPLGEYFITTGADITDIKKAELALRESEERFRTLADNIPQLCWMANADGWIFWYNKRWYEYTGMTPEQMEGWGWQSVHDPEVLPQVLDEWKVSIATGKPFDMVFPLRGSDGDFRPFLTRVMPVFDKDGKVVRWFGTNTDITERKRAEEELQNTRDQLAEKVEERTRELREKEVLLKEVHHRVKNNLQVISSLVGLQADGSSDETVREVLRDVIYRVRSMALVHEKLYQSADLACIDFAEYAKSLLGYLWRAHGAAAAEIRMTPELEQVTLPVDTAVPCGLILNELAGNALKHAFRGRTDGEVKVALSALPEGRVSLCVRDNGVGLPPGLDWRNAPSLGLRLVRMLAGQLGADVEVSSGAGTSFEVVFSRIDYQSKPRV